MFWYGKQNKQNYHAAERKRLQLLNMRYMHYNYKKDCSALL